MNLLLPISYNGFTAAATVPGGGGPTTGTTIEAVDFAQIPVAVQMNKTALKNGATLSDAYLSGRVFNVTGKIWGASIGQMEDLLKAWLTAFSPSSPTLNVSAPFRFSDSTIDSTNWSALVIPQYMTAAPMREPWHEAFKADKSAPGAHSMIVYAQLAAADPFKYVDAAVISQNLTTASAALSYRGKAPAWPTLQLALTGAGPSSITIDVRNALGATGLGYSHLTINTSGLSTGAMYEIPFSVGHATLSGVAVAGVCSASDIFGCVTPGAAAYYHVNVGTPGNITYIRLVYPEAFF